MAPQLPQPPTDSPIGPGATWMAEALAAARRALAAGEPPVGACVVLDGRLLAVVHNGVVAGPDPTAHAEILAIREGCRQLRSHSLAGAVLYVTVEPCAMCLAACYYAGIDHVVYGAALGDLAGFTGGELRGPVPPGLRLTGGVGAAECLVLLQAWATQSLRRTLP